MDLALFDFDGTITTRELFPDFMHFAVEPKRLAVGKIVLAPLILGYKLGLVPGNVIRASIVRFGFRGVPEATLLRAGQAFSSAALPGVMRPMALERIGWHKARGDTVVVVSGALDLYLSHWCEQHGLELMCSALEVKDGVLTGRYLGQQCVGKEKPRRVLAKYDVRDFSTVYAYGDTKEDLELLGIADEKYFRWRQAK